MSNFDFSKYLAVLEAVGYLTIEREIGPTPETDITLAANFLRDIINK